MITEQNLDSSLKALIKGVPGMAEKLYVCKDGGAAKDFWGPRVAGDKIFSDPASGAGAAITAALAAATSGRNDVIHLSPDSHTIAAAIDWNKNMTHLVGMYPEQMMNQRARIGQSVALANMFTVSGYGNMLANLYFMYGTSGATNLNLLNVTGDRNSFINCHFGGPMHATPADQAGFDLVKLSCGEVYFKNCTFGIDTVLWTNGDMINAYGGSDRSLRAVFENCIFLMRADNAQVNFFQTDAGAGNGFLIFKNCMFINLGTSLTVGIDNTGVGTAMKFIQDVNTMWTGVTDIIAAASEASVIMGTGNYVAAATANGIATTFDHTA